MTVGRLFSFHHLSLQSKFLMSGTIEQCYHFIVQMDIQWKESELQIALLLQQARRNGIIIHSDDKVPDKDEQNVQEVRFHL